MRRRVGETDKRVARAFGQVLSELRAERGLSQETLAEMAGCSRNNVGSLERGQQNPSLLLVFDLAKALGVSPVYLVSRTKAKEEEAAQRQEQEC